MVQASGRNRKVGVGADKAECEAEAVVTLRTRS